MLLQVLKSRSDVEFTSIVRDDSEVIVFEVEFYKVGKDSRHEALSLQASDAESFPPTLS
jgi:hypothetical protein